MFSTFVRVGCCFYMLFRAFFLFMQVLFGLCASVNLNSVTEDLLRLLSSDGNGVVSSTVCSSEYRFRATVSPNATFYVKEFWLGTLFKNGKRKLKN